MHRPALPTLWLFMALAGCEGRLEGEAGQSLPPQPGPAEAAAPPVQAPANPFTCADDEAPDALDARRLARDEYQNAVRDLLVRALGPAETTALLTRIDFEGHVPPAAHGGWSTSDPSFTVLHATQFFEVADALARELGTDPRYARFVSTYIGYAPGGCTLTNPDTLSDACEDALISNFLLRAWGRPVETSAGNLNDERAAFRAEFALAPTSRAGVEAMVVKALLAPQFLFHLELDLRDGQGEVYALSSYAIARRLAFALTHRPPDEALLAMAGAGDLSGDAAFEAALAHVRAQLTPTLAGFSREWLQLDELPAFTDAAHPKALRIREGLTANDALRDAMRDEVTELFAWVSEHEGSLGDVFTSDLSFARHPDLVRIYGQASPAPVVVTDSNGVRFPAGQRSGLLTRAALLHSGGHTENPIHRAHRLRSRLLCQPTPLPGNLPPDALAPPLPDAQLTTRERYHAKTSGPACQGCHALLNPLGFAFSRYNALGAYQATEPAYDASWSYVGELPVDSRVDLTVALGTAREVADGVELSEVVAASPALWACATRHSYGFLTGASALPAPGASCDMRRMYQGLSEGRPLRELFTSAVTHRRFRQRTLRSTP